MNLMKRYANLSQASILIPIFTGIRNYKRLTQPFRILFYFFIIAALFEIQSNLAIEIWQNNMPGQHLYTLVEFLAFSIVFYLQIQKNSIMRPLILINALVFLIVALADALWFDGIKSPNDLSRSYSSVSLILYSLVYLYYLFTIDDVHYMWEYPMFWICIGILIYFAINFTYFISKQFLMDKNLDMEWDFYKVHETTNIIANCLYAQSFRCFGKKTTAS